MMDANIHRHEIAFRGEKVFAARKSKRIVVCGAGALGSNLVVRLAKCGFNNLTIIDFDKVEAHNIANQIYGKPDVGSSKVNACASYVAKSMGVIINAMNIKLMGYNAKKLVKDSWLVVDTFDNFESRKEVQLACRANIPCAHAGMSDSGFSEVKWDDCYHIPKVEAKQEEVCDYPLAFSLVNFTVDILLEAVIRFADKNEKINYEFTLNDMKISTMKG